MGGRYQTVEFSSVAVLTACYKAIRCEPVFE